MKVAFFGTGYVGLVTGTCLAQTGNSVTCVDIDKEKVKLLKRGGCPIFETGLQEMIEVNIREKRLNFTTNAKKVIQDNYLLFVAVGTPSLSNGEADLSAVFSVARSIGKYMDSPKIIIQKSTVPVGTGTKLEKIIKEELKKRNRKISFEVVSNPEFLKEGSAVEDFMSPDRIVLGTEDEEVQNALEQLYAPLMRKGHRVVWMNRESAELTKYAANAMLATRISFMNNLARLAEKVGADIEMVRQGIGSDTRIGRAFIYAGLGFGGSCFPKDVDALTKTIEQNKLDSSLLRSVRKINKEQREWFFDKIKNYFKGDLKKKTFAVWGLAFKAQTDDVREASSLDVIKNLLDNGAKVKAFDPEAVESFKNSFGKKAGISYAKDEYQVLKDADALIILTEWLQFRNPDFDKIKSSLKNSVIFDGRNLYEPKVLKRLGIDYECIGR